MKCEVEECKANMEHRLGIHSNWCPNWTITDGVAKDKMMNQVREIKKTKVEIMIE